jgi:thiol-disulfide isomerase/thioredoxin
MKLVGSVLGMVAVCWLATGCAAEAQVQALPTTAAAVPKAASVNVQISVRGHILDSAGKPLPLAHARLLGPNGKPVETAQAGPDGSFSLSLARVTDRIARVQVTAVDRKPETVLLVMDEPSTDLTVKLGTPPPPPAGQKPVVALVKEGGSFRKALSMTEGANGTWSAEEAVPDGKYLFRIMYGMAGYVTATTPAASGFQLEDGYNGIVEVTGGKASFVHDPAKRLPAAQPAAILFANPNSMSAATTALSVRIAHARAELQGKVQAAAMAKQDPTPIMKAGIDPKAKAFVGEMAAAHKEPAMEPVIALAELATGAAADSKATAQKVLDTVKPNEVIWSVFGPAETLTLATDQAKAAAYRNAMIEEHPDTELVAGLLMTRVGQAKQANNEDELRKAVTALKQDRFKGTSAQALSARFDPDRPLAPGKMLPAFEFKALKGDKLDAKKTFKPKNFENSVYLIDVWATWCKPCVAELPHLHEIYAKYASKARGKKALKMMSVSLDAEPATVAKFRGDKEHPMPWMQAFAGANSDVVKRFTGSESTAIPLYVLVGRDGKILAASPDITADKLPAILDKALQ